MPLARCSSGAAAASPPFRSHTLDSGWHFLDPGLALAHLHATLIEGALCRPKGIACPQGRLSLHLPTVPEREPFPIQAIQNTTGRQVSKSTVTCGLTVLLELQVSTHGTNRQTNRRTDRRAGRQPARQRVVKLMRIQSGSRCPIKRVL